MSNNRLLLGGIGLIAGGLLIHLYTQYRKLSKIQYRVIGAKIKGLDRKGIDISIILDVDNTSDVDVTITGYDFDVMIDGRVIGNVRDNKNQYVRARGSSTIAINSNIPFRGGLALKEILDLTSKYLTDKDSIRLGYTGNIKVKQSFISFNIPLSDSYNLAELKS